MVQPGADDAKDDGDYQAVPDVVGVNASLLGQAGRKVGAQSDAGHDQQAVPADLEGAERKDDRVH